MKIHSVIIRKSGSMTYSEAFMWVLCTRLSVSGLREHRSHWSFEQLPKDYLFQRGYIHLETRILTPDIFIVVASRVIQNKW